MYYYLEYTFRVSVGCILIDFISVGDRDMFWIQQSCEGPIDSDWNNVFFGETVVFVGEMYCCLEYTLRV